MVSLVFSMQGVGSLMASLTGYILVLRCCYLVVILIFGFSFFDIYFILFRFFFFFVFLFSLGEDYDLMWRLALGIGAIPGVLSMYFRVTMVIFFSSYLFFRFICYCRLFFDLFKIGGNWKIFDK
jgi:hypothetical protein